MKFLLGRWDRENAQERLDQIAGGEPYSTNSHKYEVKEK